jgi:ribosome-binding factor A|tara:strand:+ start:8614 stop:8958 length:345 start_codon:yes stop_codon:yes gene_type:complete
LPKDYPRSVRISQQIKKELADLLLFQIKDPALNRLTILDVEVSPCLKHAKVFFVVSKYDEEVAKGLKRSMPFLRSQLAKKMTTRGIPKLHFVYDKTIDESMKISQLLDSALNPK